MGENNHKKIFSKNLRYYMALNGKNQIDLMNDLRLSSSTVSNWCTGLKLPRMDKVQILADYFHINKSDLIEEHTQASSSPDYSNFATPEEFESIIKKYRSLDSHGQEHVTNILEWESARVKALSDKDKQIKKLENKLATVITPKENCNASLNPKNEDEFILNAAHERTDIEVTNEMRQHDDDIMNDDNEWE